MSIRTLAVSDAEVSASSLTLGEPQHYWLLTAVGAFMGVAVGGGTGIALMEPQKVPKSPAEIPVEDRNIPPPRPDLPTIDLETVAEHNDESSMWFT